MVTLNLFACIYSNDQSLNIFNNYSVSFSSFQNNVDLILLLNIKFLNKKNNEQFNIHNPFIRKLYPKQLCAVYFYNNFTLFL